MTKLTGIPFRLAAGGLQGGLDGDAAWQNDPVCFEAKLYSRQIDREDVLVKIADLGRRKEFADRLWILASTIEISTQLSKDVEVDGDKHAISTLILDWGPSPLPLLAVAIVAADVAAVDFIIKNKKKASEGNGSNQQELRSAFSSISNHPEFGRLLERLKLNLNIPKLSSRRAVEFNVEWRRQTFSSTRHARERLGQGLAVLKDKSFPPMRLELQKRIADALKEGKDVILVGDEGNGKSWLAAQLCSDEEGLALFISAEQLDGVSVQDLDDLLIDLLVKQTGEVADEMLKLTRNSHEPRLVLWEDGAGRR